MNKRQAKKHLKKILKLSIVSLELADRYINRYRVKKLSSLMELTYPKIEVIRFKNCLLNDITKLPNGEEEPEWKVYTYKGEVPKNKVPQIKKGRKQ